MPFLMEKQKQSEWCWAAVALSIERYFSPYSVWGQCGIAAQVLKDAKDSCEYPENHDEPAQLETALAVVSRLRNTRKGPMKFEEIQQELDAGRPVCVRIKWIGDGAHFVVLTGYKVSRSNLKMVDIADPLYPDSTRAFDDFPSAYQGGGEWTDSFLVRE